MPWDPGDDAHGGWIMPWQRPPAWLYLSHQEGGVDRMQVKRRRTEDQEPCPNSVEGEDASGFVDDSRHGGVDQADGGVHTIRGRSPSPGPSGRTSGCGRSAAGDATASGINGPSIGPGARVNDGLSRAQLQLDARNAHLRRSLNDHRDRVERRRAEVGDTASGPTPAERLAAIRRRVAGRASSSGATLPESAARDPSLDYGGGQCAGSQCQGNTIEVYRIQFGGDGVGGCADAGGAACATAVDDAASLVAWHGREGSTRGNVT